MGPSELTDVQLELLRKNDTSMAKEIREKFEYFLETLKKLRELKKKREQVTWIVLKSQFLLL